MLHYSAIEIAFLNYLAEIEIFFVVLAKNHEKRIRGMQKWSDKMLV
jgi:hypothetical protein